LAALLLLDVGHLIHFLTIPQGGSRYGRHSFVGCHAIVAALFLAVGGCIASRQKEVDSFNPLPDESAQVLKENIEWIANKK